jgi:hypothetical protein
MTLGSRTTLSAAFGASLLSLAGENGGELQVCSASFWTDRLYPGLCPDSNKPPDSRPSGACRVRLTSDAETLTGEDTI